MVSDRARLELFQALEARLGAGPAETLMASLPPIGWADFARQADIAELRGEIGQLRGEIGELRGEIGELRGRIDSLMPRIVIAQIATMFGFGSLLVAAAVLI